MNRKITQTVFFLLLSTFLLTPAFADKNGHDEGYRHHGKKKWMMHHHKQMDEINGMLRDVMVILRDLNHKPSAAERNQLNNMIHRMDEIMEERKHMREKYMKKRHHGDMDMDHDGRHHGDADSE